MMRNLLVIDHNQAIQTLLAKCFDRAMTGSYVYQVPSIQAGIDILETKEIDIIIIGVNTITAADRGFYDKIRTNNKNPLIIFLLPEQDAMIWQQIAEFENMAAGRVTHSDILQLPLPKFENDNRKEAIMLSTAIGVYPVIKDSILAIERIRRNSLNVYTPKRMFKDVRGTLAEKSKLLSVDFVFINRHCIVNRKAITRIIPKTREIYLDIDSTEITFSCSRDKIKEIIAWLESLENP